MKQELTDKVPSNLKVALAVADRVYDKMECQGIDVGYERVFDHQEALGIIEPVKKKSFFVCV